MASRAIKKTLKGLSKLKDFDERIEDLSTQLNQFISLASIRDRLPPIPPNTSRSGVAGAYYATFFKHGKDMFNDLENLLKSHGLSFFDFNRILDFGCGCGRFMIPMSFLIPPGKSAAPTSIRKPSAGSRKTIRVLMIWM